MRQEMETMQREMGRDDGQVPNMLLLTSGESGRTSRRRRGGGRKGPHKTWAWFRLAGNLRGLLSRTVR